MDTLHEDRFTFLIISRSVLVRMRNVSDKNFRVNQNTHFMLIFFFFFLKINPFFSDNVEKYCRTRHAPDDNIIPRMRTACWIPKATDTRSENVTLFHYNNGYTNVPQRYVTRTLPVLFTSPATLWTYNLCN